MKIKEIDFEEISEYLCYDESSPSGLRWKERCGTIRAGVAAGCVLTTRDGHKSWTVRVNNKMYYAHRVIYCLMFGRISSDLNIDHIDGNALNNNIVNLRLVSQAINTRNLKMFSTNNTGVTGVNYRVIKEIGQYVAHYCDASGKLHSKSFSCNKYGSSAAFELACKWRTDHIQLLNNELGSNGYTARHGENIEVTKPQKRTNEET